MTMLRAFLVASVLGALVLAACGGAGSGGAGGPSTSPAPALGTNNPAASPNPSGDPYSDGY
jgi:ABC-type glycerol-3-phosphate transport system substrate-binding protein